MTSIVLIDDNNDNLRLMIFLLNHYGYSTYSAEDGETGLKIIREVMPDLVLCDIQIPRINGYEVARQLRIDDRFANIPMIAVTAFSLPGDKIKILKAGFKDFLTKPINPEIFVQQIEKYLPPALRATKIPAPKILRTEKKGLSLTEGTVLIVDSNDENAVLTRNLLETLHFNTKIVYSGAECLKMLQRFTPELIVSNMHWPETDCLGYISKIRKDPSTKNIPIILILSNPMTDEETATCKGLGITYFVNRPIEPIEFINTVKDAWLVRKEQITHGD